MEARFELHDANEPELPARQLVRVSGTKYGISIAMPGFGDKTSSDGEGAPIYLDFCDGKMQLLVWADINQEDPTHVIDMSGALESNREAGPVGDHGTAENSQPSVDGIAQSDGGLSAGSVASE